MRVAPDIDRLMWTVAESGDPAAVADFESRFPALRYELSKRIDLVRELKASKRLADGPPSIPAFRIARPSAAAAGMRWRWSLAAVGLSALAVGSFFVTKQLIARNEPAPNPLVSEPPPTSVLPTPVPDPVEKRPDTPSTVIPPASGSGLQPPDDEPIPVSKWEIPQTIKFERLGLANAIRAIGVQCGLTIEMPPDMPNDEIMADYRNMTAFEILADMGERFGFTAFDQGEGRVLVVPAREGSNSAGADPGVHPVDPNIRPERRSPSGN